MVTATHRARSVALGNRAIAVSCQTASIVIDYAGVPAKPIVRHRCSYLPISIAVGYSSTFIVASIESFGFPNRIVAYQTSRISTAVIMTTGAINLVHHRYRHGSLGIAVVNGA